MARFDLNLLGALDALLNERNVTRAAEKLHVTQPTMSGMLQRLRYQFKDELLERSGRSMELTPFATALIGPVRQALREVEALAQAEPEFEPATSTRSFTIMASDYCTSIFLPRVVARLARVAPGVRLIMQPLNAPVERLVSAEVDLCISADDLSLMTRNCTEERLVSEYLFSDRFVCIVRNGHPLDESSSLQEYLSFPHVGLQMMGMVSSMEAASLRQSVPHFEPTYLVAEFSQVPCMVARTDLVGVVQQRLAQNAARWLPVRTFKPPFALSDLNEVMLWHPRHLKNPSHVWLRQILFEEAQAWREEGQPKGQGSGLAAIPDPRTRGPAEGRQLIGRGRPVAQTTAASSALM